jgi:hypothetical protein
MAATLNLTREGFGIELRRGTFEILVDDKNVGSIEWHGGIDVPVEPGPHTLRIRAGRYASREHPFEAADGERIAFRLHGAMIWPLYVASIFKPELAISLKREDVSS